MMTRHAVLTSACLLIILAGACTPMLDVANPPGEMNPDDTITPCHRYALDQQACGNAIFNGRVIGGVQLGQSKQEVLGIMSHEPERREALMEGGTAVERWNYLTDYDLELTTMIEFHDGIALAITQTPWRMPEE